jgi:4-hydroxy-tetrahydrodipicolinate synthase
MLKLSGITTAVGTPLTKDEQLHKDGLAIHLDDQANHGICNILAAGTMGAMQLLTDETYKQLVRLSVDLWAGRGEILIGAGDAGFARSRDRILFLNDFKIDGVAVLAPYFWGFGQSELIDYYSRLADISKAPLYLYDLPQVTGTKIAMDTFSKLSKHPNIKGAKVSCDFDFSRQLIDIADDDFRVIVAQPNITDMLLQHGVKDQLEGVWSITPGWIAGLVQAAEKQDWCTAKRFQLKITKLRNLLGKYGFAVFTNMMNARGIPGCFTPLPFAGLTKKQNQQLLNEPVIKQLIEEDPVRM